MIPKIKLEKIKNNYQSTISIRFKLLIKIETSIPNFSFLFFDILSKWKWKEQLKLLYKSIRKLENSLFMDLKNLLDI